MTAQPTQRNNFKVVADPVTAGEYVAVSEAVWTWARIAALSFGGPAGQIAVMHRILVEEKRWIGETRFLHALNYCMLLPGPEAHQLAVYIGWLLHRIRGGILAGTLFVLPGLFALGVLSWLYAAFGQIGIVGALFFGMKAAVLAVVLEAVQRIGKRALKSAALLTIAALAFIGIFFFAIPFPVIIAASALLGFAGRHLTPDWFKAGDGTHGFEDFAAFCRIQDWPELEAASGISQLEMRKAAETYMQANAVIANYGMGITQHEYGVECVKMIVNLLLLRGNIGKPGAGISPIRGHSNVQGQRTVGISEKTKLVPLDKLKELYGFEPPREDGLTTVDACQAIVEGKVRGFVSLGGNFVRAIPEREMMEKAWRKLQLSVQIATKLNRSHLLPGQVTYLLPCLGRIEIDEQATGPQAVSMEDSTACIHGSRGQRDPVSEQVRSEPFIVAGVAKATLPPNSKIDWDKWVGDYSLVRDAIEATYPDQFKNFNERLFTPGGFPRPLGARERKWKTPNGKANFTVPESLPSRLKDGPDIYQLMTVRADGQFNTTIYNEDDRFRGVRGGRKVVLMNEADIVRLKLHQGDLVKLSTAVDDGIDRELGGLQVMPYDIPEKCIAGYYPECNVLIPLWHYAKESKVPAAKSIPVRVTLQHEAP